MSITNQFVLRGGSAFVALVAAQPDDGGSQCADSAIKSKRIDLYAE